MTKYGSMTVNGNQNKKKRAKHIAESNRTMCENMHIAHSKPNLTLSNLFFVGLVHYFAPLGLCPLKFGDFVITFFKTALKNTKINEWQ